MESNGPFAESATRTGDNVLLQRDAVADTKFWEGSDGVRALLGTDSVW